MNHSIGLLLHGLLAIPCVLAEPQPPTPPTVEIRQHLGRPVLFIDGQPRALSTYSPVSWHRPRFQTNIDHFLPHRLGAYLVSTPMISDGWGASPTWTGDDIRSKPVQRVEFPMEETIGTILKSDPNACLIVRGGVTPPQSWLKLHPDQLFVAEDGAQPHGYASLQVPSLASELYWDALARGSKALVEYCEAQPGAHRIIGYWLGFEGEGTYAPLTYYRLFDHSPVMTARWRRFLQEKYETVERLRRAYRNEALTFETIAVPKDPLLGPLTDAANQLYWQSASENQPRRDYLELVMQLTHVGYRRTMAALRAGTSRSCFFVYDAFKQSMLGWNLQGFFDPNRSWLPLYPELMAGSGHLRIADVFDAPGCDGGITPHDYQARGVGGIFEPEGIADSLILRGKLFFCEMDTRTYAGGERQRDYGQARTLREFEAVTWRNWATAFTRGFTFYWMDLCADWFSAPEMQPVIERQARTWEETVQWPHETVPGIAMIVDDAAVLETNGSGHYFNEAIMWEMKIGLGRCGVPYRLHLFDDLRLEQFPRHRVFYFPNLFRADADRLALLRQKVFCDGNVVVWGPGSGISDGLVVSDRSAAELTGFAFEPLIPANYPRRTLITNFDHPITAGLKADVVLGGPLPYGPLMYPKDGTALGSAWTKQGLCFAGLSVKEFGRGARGKNPEGTTLGQGDWASVFTTAVPLTADIWRNLARYAGAHVYCDSNDILLADRSVVALHSIQSGEKTIRLPGSYRVTDVVSGEVVKKRAREIRFVLSAPETRVFRLTPNP